MKNTILLYFFLIASWVACFVAGGHTYTANLEKELFETNQQLNDCLEQLDEQENNVNSSDTTNLASAISTTVTVTCYQSKRAQTDSTPRIGAFNVRVGHGSIAVSRDLLKKGFPPLSQVWIDGFGIYTVHDTMHPRWKDRVDIWVPDNIKPFKKTGVRIVSICQDNDQRG